MGGKGEPGCPQGRDRAGWAIGVFEGQEHLAAWLLMALIMADLMWPPPRPQTLQHPCSNSSNSRHRDCIGATKWLQRSWTWVSEGLQSSCKEVAKCYKRIGKMLQRGCKLFTQNPCKAIGSGAIGGVWNDSLLSTLVVPGPAAAEGLLGCSRGVQPYPWAWSGLFTRQTISSTLISPLGTVLRSFS